MAGGSKAAVITGRRVTRAFPEGVRHRVILLLAVCVFVMMCGAAAEEKEAYSGERQYVSKQNRSRKTAAGSRKVQSRSVD